MFDMQRVCKTISTLRKARNMTQMELADRMNISFQAVSNWERGQTLPDISKLSELSDIFGVTIDELLGNEKDAAMVEKLIRQEPIQEEISAEEFLNVAPLVKPAQAETLWARVKADVSLKDLADAAPFLSEAMLDSLAVQAVAREKSFQGLSELLPFMSGEAIGRCMDFVLTDVADLRQIVQEAPLLGEESINRLAAHLLNAGDIKNLVALAPFMKKKKLTEVAAGFIENYGFSKILPLLPFLDTAQLEDFFPKRDNGQQ